jgi:hypothetical protein
MRPKVLGWRRCVVGIDRRRTNVASNDRIESGGPGDLQPQDVPKRL